MFCLQYPTCLAAPMAITSSGDTEFSTSAWGTHSCTSFWSLGILVEPPHNTTCRIHVSITNTVLNQLLQLRDLSGASTQHNLQDAFV